MAVLGLVVIVLALVAALVAITVTEDNEVAIAVTNDNEESEESPCLEAIPKTEPQLELIGSYTDNYGSTITVTEDQFITEYPGYPYYYINITYFSNELGFLVGQNGG